MELTASVNHRGKESQQQGQGWLHPALSWMHWVEGWRFDGKQPSTGHWVLALVLCIPTKLRAGLFPADTKPWLSIQAHQPRKDRSLPPLAGQQEPPSSLSQQALTHRTGDGQVLNTLDPHQPLSPDTGLHSQASM